MAQIRICIEPGCKNAQTTEDFCRLHYLKNWRQIKESTQKKAADKLNKYVEGICDRHPDKYVDVIRREIKTGKGDFATEVDTAMSGDPSEVIFDDTGVRDDESIDKLLSRIKVDKEF